MGKRRNMWLSRIARPQNSNPEHGKVCGRHFMTEGVQNQLSCYQCNVTHEDDCDDSYLSPCPDNQAYDKCETHVRKRADGRRWVEKGCAVAPCLPFRQGDDMPGFPCDYSAPDYDCLFCCKESGCNGRAAASLPPPRLLLRLLPLLALLTPLLAL